MLVQFPNTHSLGLKTANTGVEIAFKGSPEQSSLSLTGSLKLFIILKHLATYSYIMIHSNAMISDHEYIVVIHCRIQFVM